MAAKQLNLVPLYVMLVVLSVVAIFAMTAKSVGIVFNVTGSMPGTVYKLDHGEKGSLTSFCSPIPHPSIGHGSCPDGSMPLIKRVVGVAGDLVTATDHGVEINGQPVPNSRPLDLDTKEQALPHLRGIFTLKQGEIWTAGEHSNSFDSRYFGPVIFPIGEPHHRTRKFSFGFVEE
ncbi:S26 family signal peptidase [Rhodoferax sp.]|uniref:S26 family signal peptidase n=1 Tax=Rhodoferax sp. TaxID=50421 RepID=UPI00260F3CCF|nr:S26 family signal peptidase [Rhodoferax sp.]MDD3936933.1 S26 family signal peptidase [Rhodoferax sp.]